MPSLKIAALASPIAAVNAMPAPETTPIPSSLSHLLSKRDYPVCDLQHFNGDHNPPTYDCYVEKNAKNIVGAGVQVSHNIDCGTGISCVQAKADASTVSQSLTFDIGIYGGVEEDGFKDGVKAGASWNWASSTADCITDTFTLAPGDKGHIVFFPYLHQSCGALAVANVGCDGGAAAKRGELSKRQCTPQNLIVNEPNACGTTLLLIQNGAQSQANGCLQFCHTDTQVGCTPDPKGCVPPPL